jgi:hypothetical protein
VDGGDDAGLRVGQEDGHAVGDEHPDRQAPLAGDQGVALRRVDVAVRRGEDPGERAVDLAAETDGRARPRGEPLPVLADGLRVVAHVQTEVETLPNAGGDATRPRREAGANSGAEVRGQDGDPGGAVGGAGKDGHDL